MPPHSATIHQTVHYYPFGLPMDCTASPDYQRWLFGDKEFDRAHGLDLYDQAARLYDPTLGRFRSMDKLSENYLSISPYLFCSANPVILVDDDGNEVKIYATTLPGAKSVVKMSQATHTFIVVTDKNGEKHYYAYGAKGNQASAALGIGGRLQKIEYNQDKSVFNGVNTDDLKASFVIDPPNGMTQEEFDNKVIEVADSFGNNEEIKYQLSPTDLTTGNCNSSTSTILLKSGISKEEINRISDAIPGFKWGFSSSSKPWTRSEQQEAVDLKRIITNSSPMIR